MGYAHRVEGGQRIKLEQFDPAEDAGLKRKEAEKRTAQSIGELIELQELLYAVQRQSVLVILQGRDTSGKDEQKRRLLDREKHPLKSWKLSPADWQEREHWDDYTAAYEDVLNYCSTQHAPWFIVPADKKWFRNLAVAETLRDALMPFREPWLEKLAEIGRDKRQAIEAYRRIRQHSG